MSRKTFPLILPYYKADNLNLPFPEYEEHEKGFAQYFDEHLKPFLLEFENAKKTAFKKTSWRIKIFTIIMTGIAAIFFYNMSIVIAAVSTLIATLVFGFATKWFIYRPLNKLSLPKKEDFLPRIFGFFGDFKYTESCYGCVPRLKGSSIIPDHCIEHSKNIIAGEYKGINIELFETCLLQTDSNQLQAMAKRRLVFQGLMITFSMNKAFNNKTIIKKNAGILSNKMLHRFPELEHVRLEDPEFEKSFQVYSGDQIEARYLLTTAFMERLMLLEKIFDCTYLECSFYNNKLLFAISTKANIFEIAAKEEESYAEASKRLLKEIYLILNIVDILKLNQNLGL